MTGPACRSGLRVRYAETDQMGVAHHANYPMWFEVGRGDLMRALGVPYTEIEARGYFLLLAGLNVRYLRAARYDEELTLETRVAEARSRKIVFAYRLLRGEELLATGTTEHVPTDKTYKIARVPADVLALLQSQAEG